MLPSSVLLCSFTGSFLKGFCASRCLIGLLIAAWSSVFSLLWDLVVTQMSKHCPHASETQIHFISQDQTCLKSILSMCSRTFSNKLTLNFYALMKTMSSSTLITWSSFLPMHSVKAWQRFLAESNVGSNMACILGPLPLSLHGSATPFL